MSFGFYTRPSDDYLARQLSWRIREARICVLGATMYGRDNRIDWDALDPYFLGMSAEDELLSSLYDDVDFTNGDFLARLFAETGNHRKRFSKIYIDWSTCKFINTEKWPVILAFLSDRLECPAGVFAIPRTDVANDGPVTLPPRPIVPTGTRKFVITVEDVDRRMHNVEVGEDNTGMDIIRNYGRAGIRTVLFSRAGARISADQNLSTLNHLDHVFMVITLGGPSVRPSAELQGLWRHTVDETLPVADPTLSVIASTFREYVRNC